MRDAGKLSAAIAVLWDFDARRTPLKTALADWARGARYAGAKDRAWISGLCLDALRRRNSIAAMMGEDSPRALAIGALAREWGTPVEAIEALAAEEPHGPGALTENEKAKLAAYSGSGLAPAHVAGDFPEWLTPAMTRVFGADAAAEGAALAARADVDLRLNTLKTTPEKALAAIAVIGAEPAGALTTAARIAAPPANARAPSVTVIPAFGKGWVEVQDLGSQIAAAAAGAIVGAQALDYCAGGGGKTLALAAMMTNKGQLYAYDSDPHRLAPLVERAQRAGVRNLQIRSAAAGARLDDLVDKMDVVFVDAPCTGSGTWRRHPDAKWRLTPQQLGRRMEEQDAALAEAAAYVKAGGRLVYVTCSVFAEENEDRLSAFFAARPEFAAAPALAAIEASGLLAEGGRETLAACQTPEGHLRLTPARTRTDGFFIATLARIR